MPPSKHLITMLVPYSKTSRLLIAHKKKTTIFFIIKASASLNWNKTEEHPFMTEYRFYIFYWEHYKIWVGVELPITEQNPGIDFMKAPFCY